MAAMRRRDFLRLSLAASAATAVSPSLLAAPVTVRLTLFPDRRIAPVPADFTGLSYETAQLGDPDFFSPENRALVGLVRRLGAQGVLRIGGNTSENSHWKADGEAVSVSGSPVGPDTGKNTPSLTAITPRAIDNLRGFLEATGWNLMYGLNMATGTPESAAEEASYVWKTCGKRALAFQIGNEADLFHQNGMRKPSYGQADFFVEWRRFFEEIRRKVPEAAFAGPDTANATAWLLPFAQEFHSELKLLTEHYYAEGPPTNPAMTLDRLLHPNPKLESELAATVEARKATGVPFRLAETNSCYSGGKEGVSNTFGAALWTAELMFQVAASGGVGINFHGGGYGWYTPIAGTREKGFSAQPGYYGMLLFQQALGQAGAAELIDARLEGNDPQVTVYALRDGDGQRLVLFNKSSAPVTVDLNLGREQKAGVRVLRLTGPSLESTDGITLGGAPVSRNGEWEPATQESLPPSGKNGRGKRALLALPAGSAALVML
ncbi:glycosyl hydrolase family 79 C-terminal domain-containing protein [Silvibacterium sp.]|uniref:glycosyl hydrolase family 79 C-terminal domain-containing protein n=1 Tax=Silvibacterium sp. TaxID=1964179 RepID=UPI0039E24EA3